MGSKIFAAGGGIIGSSCVATTAYYDTSLNSPEWIGVADMNFRRTEAAGCVHNGFFYGIWTTRVIGGGDFETYEGNEYAHCERYDPQKDSWSMIAPMSQERRGCSAISFNGRIYVAGGHYNDGDYVTLRTVEAYDPNTDQCERLADLTIQRQKPTLIVSDGKLMAMGGYSDFWDQERLSSVEEYDKENNTWKERREMQMANGHPYIFALPTSDSIPTELQL